MNLFFLHIIALDLLQRLVLCVWNGSSTTTVNISHLITLFKIFSYIFSNLESTELQARTIAEILCSQLNESNRGEV